MVAFGFAKRTLRVIFQLSSGAVWELCLECGTTPSVVFVLYLVTEIVRKFTKAKTAVIVIKPA